MPGVRFLTQWLCRYLARPCKLKKIRAHFGHGRWGIAQGNLQIIPDCFVLITHPLPTDGHISASNCSHTSFCSQRDFSSCSIYLAGSLQESEDHHDHPAITLLDTPTEIARIVLHPLAQL